MALDHAAPGEPWTLQRLGDAIATTPSSALFKSAQLEVMRLVLPAGRSLPPHSVSGELTLQCIEGDIRVELADRSCHLRAGQLLFLEAGQVHALTAVQDASALLTLVVGGAQPGLPSTRGRVNTGQ